MASERRHIPVGKRHIGVGNVCIWCDQLMPCREILLDENKRLLQRSRDEDTARIRLNHARIEAEEKVARLTALLAERDAEIARLREALEFYARDDHFDASGVPGRWTKRHPCRCGYCDDTFEPDDGAVARAALAARGGEVQG